MKPVPKTLMDVLNERDSEFKNEQKRVTEFVSSVDGVFQKANEYIEQLKSDIKNEFENVSKFVELFGGELKNQNQEMLFDDHKINYKDKNLFFQNIDNWNSTQLLNNELEVIGFYFSDHPLNYYPADFFT